MTKTKKKTTKKATKKKKETAKRKSKTTPKPPTIDSLFRSAAKTMKQSFERVRESVPHYGSSGREAEIILTKFLNEHLPRRFAATAGIVIDEANVVSKQQDVLVYDAENSPIYLAGEETLILPVDSVASVIEVKSMLTKDELEDAVGKIASVKKLKRNPISDADQLVTRSSLVVNSAFGVVFAYDSKTTLETLAENLKEFNKTIPSSQWVDAVIVLGKGMIGYQLQLPGHDGMIGQMMPPADENFVIPSCYIHMTVTEDGEYALNRFFATLVSQLAFYRKKSSVSLDRILQGSQKLTKTIQGYWFDTSRRLQEVPASQMGSGPGPVQEFDAFHAGTRNIIARFSQYDWADGYIYRIVPRAADAFKVAGLIFQLTKQEKVHTTPGPDGIMGYTSLLKGTPPTREEIKEHVEKQTNGAVEIKWYN